VHSLRPPGHLVQLVPLPALPAVQANARDPWIEARSHDLLPVAYAHVVFTLPHQFAPLALQNKRVAYHVLFRTSAATLIEVASLMLRRATEGSIGAWQNARSAGWKRLNERAPRITYPRYWDRNWAAAAAELFGRRARNKSRRLRPTHTQPAKPWWSCASRESSFLATHNISGECDTSSTRRWKTDRGW
jgi:hypothetical protein